MFKFLSCSMNFCFEILNAHFYDFSKHNHWIIVIRLNSHFCLFVILFLVLTSALQDCNPLVAEDLWDIKCIPRMWKVLSWKNKCIVCTKWYILYIVLPDACEVMDCYLVDPITLSSIRGQELPSYRVSFPIDPEVYIVTSCLID